MRCPSLLAALLLVLPLQGRAGKITGATGNSSGVQPADSASSKPTTPTTSNGETTVAGNTGSDGTSNQTTTVTNGAPSAPVTGVAVQPTPSNPQGQPQAQDPPQLAQTKEQAWNLLNSGNRSEAQALIKEALKEHPEDKDLQSLAQLGETHRIGMDGNALAKKMALLGSARETGALGGTAAQAAPQKPMLASALGFLGAGAQPQLAAQAPAALKGALSQATFLKMRLKDYSGAERDLTETIKQDPANWLAFRLRAFTRRFMRKIPEAEGDANRALELNPKDGPSHAVKALLRLDARDPEAAVREASEALKLNGKDPDAYATRAQALGQLGRREESLADFKAAADLDPQFAALYRQALYESGAGGGPGLTRLHALYAAAAGLALMFFSLSLVSKKAAAAATTTRRPAMRAEDNTPSGVQGFRILRRLGQGGMGVVYEAYDEALQRKVALKRMREEIAGDPRERRRFMREARLVAGLRHPGIVEIFSLVEQNEALYLVFEYLPGQTLHELIGKRGGRLSPAEALPRAREIAEALDFAHAQGVVHQDLKPSNVLVMATGAKVMDFGIARRVQETLSTMSRAEAAGTPAYMSPEQEQGVVTPKADLFALGVLVYEMLAGQAPFGRGGAFSKIEARFRPLSELAGLPAAVDDVMASALDPDPAKRPASACAFVAALESVLAARA